MFYISANLQTLKFWNSEEILLLLKISDFSLFQVLIRTLNYELETFN